MKDYFARLRWPWLILAIGALFGSFAGEFPKNEPVMRGGYRVLESDFHVHTRFSDGFLSPLDVVLLARRKAVDVVGLTEHNMIIPGKLARKFAERFGDGLIVIPGEEITTRDYHLIALGLEKVVPGGLPIEEAVKRVHAQGGIAIAAHPVQRFWPIFDRVLGELDGMEVVHPIAIRERGVGLGKEHEAGEDTGGGTGDSGGWRWHDMVEYWKRAREQGHAITAIGSSDYHIFDVLGVCRTFVFAERADAEAVLAAIRAGRTVVRAPNGEIFGDPELIALLEREPMPEKNKAPSYPATSAFDAIARAIAWLGFLAVVMFRRAYP